MTNDFSPDLKVGVTLAIFNLSGNIPWRRDSLKTSNKGSLISLYTSLRTLLSIRSTPGDLFLGNVLNAVSSSGRVSS